MTRQILSKVSFDSENIRHYMKVMDKKVEVYDVITTLIALTITPCHQWHFVTLIIV